ncbi:MAG: hypothetical protein RLZZ499_3023 [Cyanobacteriota bacterium]
MSRLLIAIFMSVLLFACSDEGSSNSDSNGADGADGAASVNGAVESENSTNSLDELEEIDGGTDDNAINTDEPEGVVINDNLDSGSIDGTNLDDSDSSTDSDSSSASDTSIDTNDTSAN